MHLKKQRQGYTSYYLKIKAHTQIQREKKYDQKMHYVIDEGLKTYSKRKEIRLENVLSRRQGLRGTLKEQKQIGL